MKTISPFWRRVRELMREIAIREYMWSNRHLGVWNLPTDEELKEGGYLERAKSEAIRIAQMEGLSTLKKLGLRKDRSQTHLR